MTRGLPPPDPRSLCPLSVTEFVEPSPPTNKIPGYATVSRYLSVKYVYSEGVFLMFYSLFCVYVLADVLTVTHSC
jgi:hypothetical protein